MRPYYEHAGITIYHGDCLDVLPGLGAVDLVVTDPPYGVGYAHWDSAVPPMTWLEWSRANARLVVFTPSNGSQYLYPPPTWTLCWARPGSVQRAFGGGFSHWEPILVYGDRNPYDVDCRVFPPNTGAGKTGHPCPKPTRLMTWLISGSGFSGTVLDPFAGSGTTLIAAKDLGRRAIGIEIEERYCEIAAKRLSQEVLPLPARVEEAG